MKFIILIAAAFIQSITCQRAPTISYISQEQIKDIGGTVELQCSVQYGQEYPVLWVKMDKQTGDQTPISSKTSLIIRDSRFALRFDTATATYTLQIKDIQETDAARYECQVLISVNNRIRASVELQVRRAPFISDNSTRAVVASEGEPITLECYASGYPAPRISWRRENNAILPTGGSIYRGNVLKIPAVRKEDRGTYYCVADNSVGRGTRRNINVEVEFAPVITVSRPREGQALQFDADLKCHVEGYPSPAITWLQNGVELSSNQHYIISQFATADEYTDATLRIVTVEKRQYGEYVCRANNKLGTREAKLELYETIIPVCPPACGQAKYGTGAIPVSSGPLIALVMLTVALYKNFNAKY
ncbi:lachesin isoform X1 [Cotesia glomerata]|uniref:Ig-like domain-containing protein n=1 Tax=Cotesia glomerata TaxID=32391 RepID=A0AAV7IF49_COTGL|nr:lachesin isoform X1 [Cotesia glomerata]KAH0550346.1 hypothetical protein KQX54_018848 [Cotesia glomerata]